MGSGGHNANPSPSVIPGPLTAMLQRTIQMKFSKLVILLLLSSYKLFTHDTGIPTTKYSNQQKGDTADTTLTNRDAPNIWPLCKASTEICRFLE